jgi:phosphatidylinositol-3-phosphatase
MSATRFSRPSARSSRLGLLTAVLAILALATSACTGSGRPRPTATPSVTPSESVGAASTGHKLLVIMLENHGRSEALRQMPHLRAWARHYGQATDYHAITHPSLPNYLAIFGGSTFGISSDCSVGARGCVAAAPSVFAQTIAAGRTARTYEESMTRPCQTATAGEYAARHGPWPYWVNAHERRLCQGHDVPAGTPRGGTLRTDVRAGRLPVTGELTPNFCHDGHDCPLRTADTWLAAWVPQLMSGPDYRNHRLTIVITFDEDDGSSADKVAMVVIDPRLSHRVVRTRCDHYCLARWLADNAHVRPLRHAARAPDLGRVFGLQGG